MTRFQMTPRGNRRWQEIAALMHDGTWNVFGKEVFGVKADES